MSQLRPARGTHDLHGEELRRHRHVAGTGREIARRYGYDEIATPIFEFSEVFQRTLGETSDIVTKEMYTFEDRGGERITLRPENTAGVVRAVISGGLTQDLPQKFYYHGPMFRYERPQKGRLRQFHQIGVELIGAAEPLADVEVIALGAHILEELGVLQHAVLDLNTLGDRAVVAEAPLLHQHLYEASRDFFARVQDGLARLGVAFELSPRLVRGLDYYTHTAFEFTTTALGAQGAVLAGGRYDGLMLAMGGPDVPGVGWAAGVERLGMLLAEAPMADRPVAIVPIGAEAEAAASALAQDLRRAGIAVDLAFKGKPGQRMKRADRLGARWAVSLGDDELARGVVGLRDLDTGASDEVARDDLLARLAAL